MDHTPSILDVAAILITLAAALSWLNHKLFKLRSTVGLALMGAEPPPQLWTVSRCLTPCRLLNFGGAASTFNPESPSVGCIAG